MTKNQRVSVLIAVIVAVSVVSYVFYNGIIFPSEFVSYAENKVLFTQQAIVSSTLTIALAMTMFFRAKVFKALVTVVREK